MICIWLTFHRSLAPIRGTDCLTIGCVVHQSEHSRSKRRVTGWARLTRWENERGQPTIQQEEEGGKEKERLYEARGERELEGRVVANCMMLWYNDFFYYEHLRSKLGGARKAPRVASDQKSDPAAGEPHWTLRGYYYNPDPSFHHNSTAPDPLCAAFLLCFAFPLLSVVG